MSATRVLGFSFAALMLFASIPRAGAQEYAYDPPDRVARLAYQSGDVEFAPSGVDDWGSAYRNRPLGTGDRLYTGDDGRAALELGGASVRLDADTALNVFDLDDQAAQFELSQGTMNLRVRWLDRGQTYEVDTPTLAFVVSQPGSYRIDVGRGRDGDGTQITVFSGAGEAYGSAGDSRELRAGRSYRFEGDSLDDVSVMSLPRRDSFDRFCFDRDYRYDHSTSRRYVSADVIGYDDLDDYGDWSYSSGYGEVWYPRQVSYGWAPYRDGRWEWIDPWGWTWVDNASWGFAPSHYGRWAYIGNRWGWIPGGTSRGAVYAPALVAFIGAFLGDGQPVGWFPLGPRDVYQPWYPVSRNYFTTVNVTNVTTINQTVINNYYNSYVNNTTVVNPPSYANRGVPNAVTVVPRNVFTGARPVAAAALRVQPQVLAQARITPAVRIAPSIASVGFAGGNARAAHGAPSALFAREVVARRTPPPAPAPIAQRFNLIANQGGKPLATAQLHELRQRDAESRPLPQRVRMAGAGAENGNAQTAMPHTPGRDLQTPRTDAQVPRVQDAQERPQRGPNPQPSQDSSRPGELPSARYARQQQIPAGGQQPTPRVDTQVPRAQDAQERLPRDERMNQPPQGDNGYTRDLRPQPPRRDVQVQQAQESASYGNEPAPQPRERPQHMDVQVPRVQDAQERPMRRDTQDQSPRQTQYRDVQVPRAQDAQERLREAPMPPPEPRVMPQDRPRVVQQNQPRVQPAPQRTTAQPQATSERPAQEPRENRKPKNKDEQRDHDSQDPQH